MSEIILVVFPAILIVAAVFDLMTMTIPNRISLLLVALFPVAALLAGFSGVEIGWHVLAGAGFLALGFAMFAMNWIGGGDAKLAAATALWIGPAALLEWTVLFALFGGVLTFGLLAMRRMMLPLVLINQPWIGRLHDPRTGVPYGIALSAAGLLIFPHTALFIALV